MFKIYYFNKPVSQSQNFFAVCESKIAANAAKNAITPAIPAAIFQIRGKRFFFAGIGSGLVAGAVTGSLSRMISLSMYLTSRRCRSSRRNWHVP